MPAAFIYSEVAEAFILWPLFIFATNWQMSN